MKRKMLTSLVLLTGLMFVCAEDAQASTSVTWNFEDIDPPLIVSNGEELHWTSPDAIDPTFPQYNYEYTITSVKAYLDPVIGSPYWQDVTDQIPEDKISGSGSTAGPCPIDIKTLSIDQTGIVTADIHIWADAAGYGHVDVTNVNLGSLYGLADILKIHLAEGSVTVTGVPEPLTMSLLGLGAIGLLRRRKR